MEKHCDGRLIYGAGAASTAMVPVLDVSPPMLNVTGIASPTGVPGGILAFTTHTPTSVGASPAN